jgi:fumarate reductase (CoM/CoB) subunit B
MKYSWVMDALSRTPLKTKARAAKHFLTGKNEYIPKEKRHADMDAVIKCALCPNMCKFDCPVLMVEKNDSVSPSGKMRLAYFIESAFISSDDAFGDMYKCAGCDACEQWCPFDFSVGELLKGVREDIVEMGKASSGIMEIKEHLEKYHAINERNVAPTNAGKGGNMLYFMGCEVASHRQEIADSMVKIFDMLDEDYSTLEDEWCCGLHFLNLGFMEQFKKFAERNVRTIEKSGCKIMVCSCPTCTRIFREVYPELGFKIKAEIFHSSEYLAGAAATRTNSLADLGREAVYHDSCVLVRKLGVEDEPREVAKKAGVSIKEAEFHGKDARCCGRGGGLACTNPGISEKIADLRIKELREQSDCIVTACPTCKSAFEGGAEVLDISEIFAMSMERGKDGSGKKS